MDLTIMYCIVLFLEDNTADVDLMQNILYTSRFRFRSQVHCLKQGLIEENILYLKIRDNGMGIVSGKIESTSSLGLVGIRKRIGSLNGVFKISGKKGGGTIQAASIPMTETA